MGVYAYFLVLLLTIYHGAFSNGGITSSFVRKEAKSIDMPFHSDVFSHPPGYNAPQQVFFFVIFSIRNSLSKWVNVESINESCRIVKTDVLE